MYVSIHATTHPIQGAGFLSLERQAFSEEARAAVDRQSSWLAHRPADEVAAEFASWARAAVPTAVVDAKPGPIEFELAAI